MRQAGCAPDDEPLETLYFGGGTPSLLDPSALGQLASRLGSSPRDSLEVTLEANPEDMTIAAAQQWRSAGVNRVSLGVQSFDQSVLDWMNRSHTPEAPASAIRMLRSAGIDSVSIDLIFALPDELHRDFSADVMRALELEPDHVSVYGLTVEHGTPLARWVSRGSVTLPEGERYGDEFLLAHEVLTDAGFEHYEVSNYARQGRRSRHNSAYWSGSEYVGLGPSAHSYEGERRRWNRAPWTAYERAVAAGEDPMEESECLVPAQRELERVYLGLRTIEGVDITVTPPGWDRLCGPAQREGWLVVDDHRARLTPEGWLRLDEVVAVLTTSGEGG